MCDMDGWRVSDVDDRLMDSGIANGGVVDKANGGEYESGTRA
jgi:hypothetical protein